MTSSTPKSAPQTARNLLIATLAMLALATTTSAQIIQLPCNVAGANVLNAQQQQALTDHADEAVSLAAASDEADASRGIRALFQPFTCNDVSADFRVKYTRALSDDLAEWLASDDARLASVAMLLAGRLGTDLTEGLLEDGLEDDRPAVRAAAAVGVRDALATYATGQDGFRDERAQGLISFAIRQLETEPNLLVVEQLANIATALRPNAELLADHIGPLSMGLARSTERARQTEVGETPASGERTTQMTTALERDRAIVLTRMLDILRVALIAPRVVESLDNSGFASAGLLSGQALAFVRDELEAGRVPAERVERLRIVVARAQEILRTTSQRLRADEGSSRLVEAFDASVASGEGSGASGEFAEAAGSWIDAGGALIGGAYGGRAAFFAR